MLVNKRLFTVLGVALLGIGTVNAQKKVEPLCATEWGQDAPYNNMCPEKDGKRCVTGCVVTATAADTVITAPSCVVTVKDAGYKMYTVKAGDTLWSIAKAYLGSGFRWGELYYLNADLLKSPRMIYVGQTLRIPG